MTKENVENTQNLTDSAANMANSAVATAKKLDDEARDMAKPQKFDENTSIRGLDLLNQAVDMNQDINKSVDHMVADAAHKGIDAGSKVAKQAESGIGAATDGIMSGLGNIMPGGKESAAAPKPSPKASKKQKASAMPAMSAPADTESSNPLQMLSSGLDGFGKKSDEHNDIIDKVKGGLDKVTGVFKNIIPSAG